MVAPKPQPHVELEGTWEEILRESPRLAGRRVRVTTVDEIDQEKLRAAAERFLAEVDKAVPDPDPPKMKGISAEVAEMMAEDLRRQGLDV
jgi:hypothetical protein